MVKPCYPLVNIQKTIENCHRNSWITHKKWWCSIVMLVYRRVFRISKNVIRPSSLYDYIDSLKTACTPHTLGSQGPELKPPALVPSFGCSEGKLSWTQLTTLSLLGVGCMVDAYIYIYTYSLYIYTHIFRWLYDYIYIYIHVKLVNGSYQLISGL